MGPGGPQAVGVRARGGGAIAPRLPERAAAGDGGARSGVGVEGLSAAGRRAGVTRFGVEQEMRGAGRLRSRPTGGRVGGGVLCGAETAAGWS